MGVASHDLRLPDRFLNGAVTVIRLAKGRRQKLVRNCRRIPPLRRRRGFRRASQGRSSRPPAMRTRRRQGRSASRFGQAGTRSRPARRSRARSRSCSSGHRRGPHRPPTARPPARMGLPSADSAEQKVLRAVISWSSQGRPARTYTGCTGPLPARCAMRAALSRPPLASAADPLTAGRPSRSRRRSLWASPRASPPIREGRAPGPLGICAWRYSRPSGSP